MSFLFLLTPGVSRANSLLLVVTGYYNPILAHGEQAAVIDAREAGANGFIIGDLPPEEGIEFRRHCSDEAYAFLAFSCSSDTHARRLQAFFRPFDRSFYNRRANSLPLNDCRFIHLCTL